MSKKTKKEGIIKNAANEIGIDVIAKKEGQTDWNVKSVEAESKTKLEDDKGDGETLTLRFFEFAVNPEVTKKINMGLQAIPTPQELFNAHYKQIEMKLWEDEWRPREDIEPRVLFSKDKTHYRIIIAAKPVKGNLISGGITPQTLSQIATPNGFSPTNS